MAMLPSKLFRHYLPLNFLIHPQIAFPVLFQPGSRLMSQCNYNPTHPSECDQRFQHTTFRPRDLRCAASADFSVQCLITSTTLCLSQKTIRATDRRLLDNYQPCHDPTAQQAVLLYCHRSASMPRVYWFLAGKIAGDSVMEVNPDRSETLRA